MAINAALRDEELSDDEVVRVIRGQMSWREWLRNDFLRFWYAVGVMALDMFLVLELARIFQVADAIGILLLLVLVMILGLLEFIMYRKIWPEGVLTGTQR